MSLIDSCLNFPGNTEQANRLYNALCNGGQQTAPMGDMFWGDYWGQLTDHFGVNWMANYHKA